jgi:hypothetical protein
MLAVNSTLQELDVSGNAHSNSSKGGPAFARALSVGISGNGALSELDVRDNTIPPAEKVLLQGACDAKGVSLRV